MYEAKKFHAPCFVQGYNVHAMPLIGAPVDAASEQSKKCSGLDVTRSSDTAAL